jgi:hypothetical protein
MLQPADVKRDAVKIARKNFGKENILRVEVYPWVASDGDNTWRVLIVVDPKVVDTISGDVVLNNMIELAQSVCRSRRGPNALPAVRDRRRAGRK